ncbi:uncharacterized protein N7498_009549 [Penicillium cinerascens]|uniref:Uncharacterized protein n=1 Tax=Penicillium cinerascens TaxID=70096 RepID=A0A9W9J6B6_9EURO|nr:uncharacterized protein N7498_009549 [Penicillium cinerascens]KAJ5190564.1 hypothetical protein N7498_009549 [Penicillium cinerascens]
MSPRRQRPPTRKEMEGSWKARSIELERTKTLELLRESLCIKCIDSHLEKEPRDDQGRMMDGNRAMPCLNLADFAELEPATRSAQIEGIKGMTVEEARMLQHEKSGGAIAKPSQMSINLSPTLLRLVAGSETSMVQVQGETIQSDLERTQDNSRPQIPRTKSHVNESTGKIWDMVDFLILGGVSNRAFHSGDIDSLVIFL